MDFVNSNFSGVLKLIIALFAVLIFIRILPLLVVVGMMIWGVNKSIKYIKTHKKEKIKSKQEKVYVKSNVYSKEATFDFSGKKIIDVDYEEVRR